MLTEEDKKLRIKRITSSVAAAIMGLNPHKSPADAKEDILGRSLSVDNPATRRGNLLEPVVLQAIKEEYGDTIGELVIQPGLVLHKNGFTGDSVDAVIKTADGHVTHVCEAKTVGLGGAKYWGTAGTDEIPKHVAIQCHWHMIHWPTADRCLVSVLFGGYKFEFRQYVLMKDVAAEKKMLKYCKNWYDKHILMDMGVPNE